MMGWAHALVQEQFVDSILAKMSDHGWDVDKARLDNLIDWCENRVDELDSQMLPNIPPRVIHRWATVNKPFTKSGVLTANVWNWYDADSEDVVGPFDKVVFEPINLGSDAQVKDYLLSIGWEPDEWNYNKKTKERTSPKITESSLESLDSINAAEIKERVQAAHRLGQLRGWRKNLRDDGRLPMIITGLTPTYRVTHGVIVNVPGGKSYLGHEMRSIFVAKPGYKMLGIDSKANQVRMLCHYMDDPDYTNTVVNGKKEDGTDIHTVNQKAAGLPTRGDAKPFFYGLLFGAQDAKLGRIINGTSADGARLRAQFMAGLPAYGRMMEGIEKFWKKHGYLVGLDGRLLRPRAPHQLLVYLLQGGEAVYMKVALAFIQKRAEAASLDFQLVGFIHDELQYMVREGHEDQLKEIAEQAFLDAGTYLKLKVPMEGDVAIGESWGDTH